MESGGAHERHGGGVVDGERSIRRTQNRDPCANGAHVHDPVVAPVTCPSRNQKDVLDVFGHRYRHRKEKGMESRKPKTMDRNYSRVHRHVVAHRRSFDGKVRAPADVAYLVESRAADDEFPALSQICLGFVGKENADVVTEGLRGRR